VLDGKTVLYPNKGAAEQLRQIHGVRVESLSEPMVDTVLGLAKMHAVMVDRYGRRDEGWAYLPLEVSEWRDRADGRGREKVTKEARGLDLANLLNKLETKVKRRVTLSLCGLGVVDLEDDDPRVLDARSRVLDLERVVAGAPTTAVAAMEPVPEAPAAEGPAPEAPAVPEVPPAPVPKAKGNGGKLSSLTERAKAKAASVQGSLIPPPAAEDPPVEREEPADLFTLSRGEADAEPADDDARTFLLAKVLTLRNRVGEVVF